MPITFHGKGRYGAIEVEALDRSNPNTDLYIEVYDGEDSDKVSLVHIDADTARSIADTLLHYCPLPDTDAEPDSAPVPQSPATDADTGTPCFKRAAPLDWPSLPFTTRIDQFAKQHKEANDE